MKYIAILAMFLLSIVAVSGALVANDVTLDNEVERSNPLAEGSDNELEQDELEYLSATITLSVPANDSDVTVNAITDISGFNYENFDNDVNESEDLFKVSESLPFTVTAGSSKSVTVQILVPSDLSAIESNFNQIDHNARVQFDSTNGSPVSTITFNVENGLELKNVELSTPRESIDCDVEDDTIALDCDDEADEMIPGEDFTLIFEIENIFNKDSNIDLEDVDIEIDTDNNDVEADDDSFEENIDAGSEEEFSQNMDVDEDVEDGDDVEVTITAIVIDENGARHGFEHTFDLEFEVPRYDVRLNTYTLSPASICEGESATINFEIENYGREQQDNVRILIENRNLGIQEIFERIQLEEEDERDTDYSNSVRIDTSLDVSPGAYPLALTVYYEDADSNDATLRDTQTLLIQQCNAPSEPEVQEPEENDNSFEVEQPTTQEPAQPQQPVTTPTTAVVSQTDSSTTLLIVALVVLLVVIAGLVIYLVRS